MGPASSAQTSTDTTPPPDVWGANASARGVSINLNRDALLPVPDVFNFIALDGVGEYGSSSQQARASLLFPGNGIILGPSLVCGDFGGSFPPQFKPILDQCLKYNYPLTVYTDSFTPDAATNGSLTLGAPGNEIQADATGARAHSGPEDTRTDAVLQDLHVLGIPPFGPVAIPGGDKFNLDTAIVDVDHGTARTTQYTEKGGLVTDAKVTLSGVHLVGGLIEIKSLTSESKVTDDAHGKQTSDAVFNAAGVTVAGVPAAITNKGLVVGAGSTTPIPTAVVDAANSILKTLDVNITTLPTEEVTSKTGGPGKASVGGIILSLAKDVEGLPTISYPDPSGGQIPINNVDPNGHYTLTVQLGLTGVLGSAASFGSDTGDLTGGDTALGTDVGGLSTDLGNFSGDVSGSSDNSGFGGSNNRAIGPARALGTTGGNTRLVRSVANNFGGRLGLFYLAVMLGVLGLCIAPRLAVPARLPGRKE